MPYLPESLIYFHNELNQTMLSFIYFEFICICYIRKAENDLHCYLGYTSNFSSQLVIHRFLFCLSSLLILQFWYLALLKAKSHVLLKPTKTQNISKMRSTTSMIIGEIVKNWTHCCYGDILPLADSWAGGIQIKIVQSYHFLDALYRHIKTMNVQRLYHRTFAFHYFSGHTADLFFLSRSFSFFPS